MGLLLCSCHVFRSKITTWTKIFNIDKERRVIEEKLRGIDGQLENTRHKLNDHDNKLVNIDKWQAVIEEKLLGIEEKLGRINA